MAEILTKTPKLYSGEILELKPDDPADRKFGTAGVRPIRIIPTATDGQSRVTAARPAARTRLKRRLQGLTPMTYGVSEVKYTQPPTIELTSDPERDAPAPPTGQGVVRNPAPDTRVGAAVGKVLAVVAILAGVSAAVYAVALSKEGGAP